jgi:hypothetical protein
MSRSPPPAGDFLQREENSMNLWPTLAIVALILMAIIIGTDLGLIML